METELKVFRISFLYIGQRMSAHINPTKGLVMCFCFFLLRPLTKTCYRDITMHALYFCRGGEVKHSDECPTCDKERGEGKGKTDHRP